VTDPGRKLSTRPWLFWLTAVACLPPLGLNLLVPLDVALRDGLQLSTAQVQAAIALYVLGLAIGQPLAGVGADRWGRRRTLLAGLVLSLGGSLAAATAPDALTLLVGRLVHGFGLSVVLVVPRATLRDLSSGATLQRGMAIISVAFAVTPAVTPLLGWWLLEWGGSWRVSLGLAPVLITAGLFVAVWCHTETRPARTEPPGWDTLAVLWGHRTPRLVALSFAAIGSIFFLLIAQVPTALRESLGLDGQGVALVMGGTYLGFLFGNLWAIRQAGRMSGLGQCAWGAGLASAGVAVIALSLVWPSLLPWTVGMLVYAIGHGMIFPATLGVVMQAMPTRAGMAAALTGMLPMAVGAAISGGAAWLPGTALQRTTGMAVLMASLGMMALLAIRWQRTQQE
jgi:MFS transporter, DHA1 family, multidrug resistance protein